MNALELGGVVVQILGWCLVQFVWQAAIVGVAYAGLRVLLPRGNARYFAAMLALAALAILPVWTAWTEVQILARAVDLGGMLITGASGSGSAAGVGNASVWLAVLHVALPWLVLAWGCGVAFAGLRVARQWRGLRAVLRASESLPEWQQRARLLGQRLGLKHAVRVLVSVRIATPTLVGWARPVVVVPLAMLARLPAEQVELILAHELAHLRRLDHLANLFQVVLETVFFYHPVVHWISHDARNERELCCDALALRASGGRRRDFVAALAGLEEFRADHTDLALAASGGVLAERAWFIAGRKPRRQYPHPRAIALLLAAVGTVIVLGAVWRYQTAQQVKNVQPLHSSPVTSVAPPTFAMTSPEAGQVALQPLRMLPVAADSRPIPVAGPSVALPKAELQVGGFPAAVHLKVPTLVGAMQDLHTVTFVAPTATAATPPQPQRMVPPVYPQQALLNGVAGKVVVAFTLDAHGRPRDLSIVSAIPSRVFSHAALTAIRQWRFQAPATPGRWYRQTFNFTPGRASGADVMAAKAGCYHTTGTHVCHRLTGSVHERTSLQATTH